MLAVIGLACGQGRPSRKKSDDKKLKTELVFADKFRHGGEILAHAIWDNKKLKTFDHLEKGIPLDEFLDDFPTVKKEQAIAVIEIASKILTSKNIEQIYETAA